MRMHRAPLDDDTVDRLCGGRLDPADAPPGYAPVAQLLHQAAGFVADEEIDHDLLGSMVQAIASRPSTTRKPPMTSTRFTAKVATLAGAALFASAGAAAAATGNLPAPAQDAVSHAVSHVGIDLPASGDHATGNTTNATDADQHGVDVSSTARSTDTSGRDHGAAVSEVARAGHGPSTTTTTTDDGASTEASEDSASQGHGRPADPGSQAPVATPNPGGTGTADTASNGHSQVGTSHAAPQASQGSANAGDHPTAGDNPGTSHRP
jgi:hypothetical protein